MNKSLKREHLFECNKELINQYEKLRANAFDQFQIASNYPLGFSVLLLRGMASWIEVCSYSESEEMSSSSKAIDNYQTLDSILPSFSEHEEAINILTCMVLSHQNELRSNYA